MTTKGQMKPTCDILLSGRPRRPTHESEPKFKCQWASLRSAPPYPGPVVSFFKLSRGLIAAGRECPPAAERPAQCRGRGHGLFNTDSDASRAAPSLWSLLMILRSRTNSVPLPRNTAVCVARLLTRCTRGEDGSKGCHTRN